LRSHHEQDTKDYEEVWVRFVRKRRTAWNARNKAALAINKYSYTYINPPIAARRTPRGGGTGVKSEGTSEEVEGESRRFSLYARRGKKKRRKE